MHDYLQEVSTETLRKLFLRSLVCLVGAERNGTLYKGEILCHTDLTVGD
jgi:hypothetical protein